MARSLLPYEPPSIVEEEEYIDMDICYTIPSPPHSRNFEFQMSFKSLDIDDITSPADELFYKGKLLPLHLPPRFELVQKLLQEKSDHPFNESITKTNTGTATTTPYESCNISPANSCHVSGELNPEDYLGIYQNHIIPIQNKKSWSKKLKLIKTSMLGLKLKASKAYLKSLFAKSGCSDESCAVPKEGQKSPFGQIGGSMFRRINSIDGEKKKMVEVVRGHRRSFSEAIKRHSTNKTSAAASSMCSSSDSSNSSSFSSANTNGLYGPQVLKRENSVNSEVECSIQGAIAYCKKSQQEVDGGKSVSDAEFYSLSASRIDVDREKQERPEICRG